MFGEGGRKRSQGGPCTRLVVSRQNVPWVARKSSMGRWPAVAGTLATRSGIAASKIKALLHSVDDPRSARLWVFMVPSFFERMCAQHGNSSLDSELDPVEGHGKAHAPSEKRKRPFYDNRSLPDTLEHRGAPRTHGVGWGGTGARSAWPIESPSPWWPRCLSLNDAPT